MTQDELLARLDERIKALDDKLDAILAQTTKTNGRLTKAEESIQKISTWKEVKEGQFKIIWIIIVGFVTAISWIMSRI